MRYFSIFVGCCLFLGFLLSPIWVDLWAGNMAKNHETYNMDKLATGNIEKTVDCYGYSLIQLSDVNVNDILSWGVIFNDAGRHVLGSDIKYLRADVDYSLYRIRLLGNFYYLECEGN